MDTGIRPFGYLTSMVVTIGLWLTVAPAIGAIARIGRKDQKKEKAAAPACEDREEVLVH